MLVFSRQSERDAQRGLEWSLAPSEPIEWGAPTGAAAAAAVGGPFEVAPDKQSG